MKILICGTPKSGNTWLRWLLHYCYDLEMIEIPADERDLKSFCPPKSFVTHQHFFPSKLVLDWVKENNIITVTTIRHPADVLLSYWNFSKWNHLDDDSWALRLREDLDRPSINCNQFIRRKFKQIYSVSLQWNRLCSHSIRYEDLLSSTDLVLEKLTNEIMHISDDRRQRALLLCQPEILKYQLADARHIKSASSGNWKSAVGDSEIEAFKEDRSFYNEILELGYDFDRDSYVENRYDYKNIDPFRGRALFDNGLVIGNSLKILFYKELPDSLRLWEDPLITGTNSYFDWLSSIDTTKINNEYPPITNLMRLIYKHRVDLHSIYEDIDGKDRNAFHNWFYGQFLSEHDAPYYFYKSYINKIYSAYYHL